MLKKHKVHHKGISKIVVFPDDGGFVFSTDDGIIYVF
jgi:hypothetical protein